MKKLLTFVLSLAICLGTVCAGFSVCASSANELGDVNGDGSVDNLDAARVLMYDAGLIDFAETALVAADVNYDGRADNLDAALILMYDAGINDTVSGGATPICKHLNENIVIQNRVDATVEADGYSGDEYCTACQNIVKKGIVLEKFTGLSTPIRYLTYYKGEKPIITLPAEVDVLEYTLKRANKEAVSAYPEIEAEILRLINEERVKAGVAPLKNQPGAYYYSNIRANECVQDFSHTRPNGKSCFSVFDDGDVIYKTAGENIYYCMGYPLDDVAEASVIGWMNSEGHRANILNPNFTSTTIGIVFIPETFTFYAVQLFMA